MPCIAKTRPVINVGFMTPTTQRHVITMTNRVIQNRTKTLETSSTSLIEMAGSRMAKRGTSTEKAPGVRCLVPLGQCRMRERRNATLIRVSLCHVAFHTIMSSEISDITRQSIAIHKLRGVSESPKDSYQHLISRGDAHQQP